MLFLLYIPLFQETIYILYNPSAAHNYSDADKPSLKEIKEGHFVYCNNEEFEKYQKEVNA